MFARRYFERKWHTLRWIIAAALTLPLLLSGCALLPEGFGERPPSTESVEATGPIQLKGAEITQYRGKRLGSIDDFRENSISGVQRIDRETYRLKVVGEVDEPLTLSYSEVLERPRFEKAIQLDCVEGWSVYVLWEGIRLADLVDEAGASPDADTVVFRCADGYSTSLPLDYIRDRDILLAYKMNEVEMPPERGFPFQVVAEDKWGYKWAKWITSIELSDDEDFRGYWESRGYDNSGDLP